MADLDLGLEEMLSPAWLAALEPTIKAQDAKDLKRFLSKKREWTIPSRENTFAALRGRVNPEDWHVIIIGQDPYPREESAVGIAFNDGAIKKWTDKLNPSFTNIVKSVLAHEKKMAKGGDIAEFRKAAKSCKLIDPPEWFEHTQKQGVMWINTSLTFSSKDLKILKEHTDFWRPIITRIFETVIEAKKALLKKDPAKKQGLVFIMWGGYAQKLRPLIEALNKAEPILPIEFIENNHPAATGDALVAFHNNNSFTKANEALKGFDLPEVHWISAEPAAGGAAAAEPADEPPKKAAKTKRGEEDAPAEPKSKKSRTK